MIKRDAIQEYKSTIEQLKQFDPNDTVELFIKKEFVKCTIAEAIKKLESNIKALENLHE